jgi:predicted DCC family thiol-disulfide oxidoreductase YuxK
LKCCEKRLYRELLEERYVNESGEMTQCDEARGDFLLYDGECPFCSAYVRMQRLRAAGVKLTLLNAREEPALVARFARNGLNVNDGMILRFRGVTYFGGDVMHVLSLLSGPTGLINRATSILFSNRTVAGALYPFLRSGRNATLWLTNRRKIGTPTPS